jgi:DNA-binding response OmpR family regulator
LVVDDHPDAAEMICMLLRAIGHESVMATTGCEGLELAAKHHIAIALLDIGLPDISGYEIARQLRAERGRNIFIAAITGWGDASDRVCAFEAGFDRHVLKPASTMAIRELLSTAEAQLDRLTGEL